MGACGEKVSGESDGAKRGLEETGGQGAETWKVKTGRESPFAYDTEASQETPGSFPETGTGLSGSMEERRSGATTSHPTGGVSGGTSAGGRGRDPFGSPRQGGWKAAVHGGEQVWISSPPGVDGHHQRGHLEVSWHGAASGHPAPLPGWVRREGSRRGLYPCGQGPTSFGPDGRGRVDVQSPCSWSGEGRGRRVEELKTGGWPPAGQGCEAYSIFGVKQFAEETQAEEEGQEGQEEERVRRSTGEGEEGKEGEFWFSPENPSTSSSQEARGLVQGDCSRSKGKGEKEDPEESQKVREGQGPQEVGFRELLVQREHRDRDGRRRHDRSLRRRAESPTGIGEIPGCFSSRRPGCHEGQPTSRDRGDGDEELGSSVGSTILPFNPGKEDFRGTGQRSTDGMLCSRPDPERTGLQCHGPFDPEDQVGGGHSQWHPLHGGTEVRVSTTGNTDSDCQSRNAQCRQGVLCRQPHTMAKQPTRWEVQQGKRQRRQRQPERKGKRKWQEARGHQEEVTLAEDQNLEHLNSQSVLLREEVSMPRPEKGPLLTRRCADALDFSLPGPSQLSEGEKSESRISGVSELEGKNLGQIGHVVLQQLLEVLSVVPLRSQTTGKGNGKCVFPLPTSREILLTCFPDLSPSVLSWLSSCCISLNSVWGGPLMFDGEPNSGQRKALELLIDDVLRIVSLQGTLEAFVWKDFFGTRSIDYKGDEVKTARAFSWSNIAPALPREIGQVALSDVCTLGCKHYVLHFDNYLKPPEQWLHCKPPRVMVADEDWPDVCRGLVDRGLCCFLEQEDIFQVHGSPLLNGMFGVTKDEWDGKTEIFRLIMNLIPLNHLCLPLSGDVETLPSWSLMSPFFLQPHEGLVISSEDVRCFFYTLSVPEHWSRYMAFNKRVPDSVLPLSLKGRSIYLASRVLPMGFLNSVSLAQHVHRNLVLWSQDSSVAVPVNPSHHELRKDLAFPEANPLWRVYLDNYDLLEKVDRTVIPSLEGTVAAGAEGLTEEYDRWGIPRNLKKSVSRMTKAEIQGAEVDGQRGVAYPRESKLLKYVSAALQVCSQKLVTQKQLQVVCGGLVYFSMFRRPLLGCLNSIWKFIESFNSVRFKFRTLPEECRLEILRCVALIPLARIDFRLPMVGEVTCSDASSSGGGICVSTRLSPLGGLAAKGKLRGEQPTAQAEHRVLSIGVFDGIGALRVALDLCSASVVGHVSIEKSKVASRVVENHFPSTLFVEDVALVDEEMVKQWSVQFSQVSLVLLGGGPPCQGVSGLNADRKGALKDLRSSLFIHIPRILGLLRIHFPWAQVHGFMESVASMDEKDCLVMSEAFGDMPWLCDAGLLTWCSRPRLYWTTWEIFETEGASLHPSKSFHKGMVQLEAFVDLEECCKPGWIKVDPSRSFPTFTTSRPRSSPGHRPAGVQHCTPEELKRWVNDCHRFPPYQYTTNNGLINKSELIRTPDIEEREYMMGFPIHYTAWCMPKSQRKSMECLDARLTLLGNTWCVPVVAWFLNCLLSPIGLTSALSCQELMDRLRPQGQPTLQGRLLRMPLRTLRRPALEDQAELARRLGSLVSVKGEDLLLNAPSSSVPRFHRLRGSVPARFWHWKVVSGWKWSHAAEHINVLEMRALLTSLRWRLEHCGLFQCRFVHLTDSLVCLHSLSRGRTSSRKLRRTVSRVNALVLLSGCHPVWGLHPHGSKPR